MEEEKRNVLENEYCPMCPHSCPLTSPSCRRGQSFAAELYMSRMYDDRADENENAPL